MSAVERVDMESAFVLHPRPYLESSQLLEVLAQYHGRIGLVARGARGARSRWRGLLQPFQPLRLSWTGRGGLSTLRAAEPAAIPLALAGDQLLAAYYVNELLLSFTTRGDAHPDLFAHYTAALTRLSECSTSEFTLRNFELALLAEIGYGLSLEREADTGQRLDPSRHYEYVVERGAVAAAKASPGKTYTGSQLLAIAAGQFESPDNLLAAKRLLRRVLAHHLGERALRTRRVFAAMRSS